MDAENFCTKCGHHLKSDEEICTQCGAKVSGESTTAGSEPIASSYIKSPKSGKVAFILCFLLGMLGAHRFYVGKKGTGLIMLLTGGGLALWVLIDLITIVNNHFEDKQGNMLELSAKPSSTKKIVMNIAAIVGWLAVFASSLLAIVFYITSGVINTVHSQLYYLETGNIKKAYSLTSKDFQKSTSIEDFEKFLNHYPSLKNNKSAFFNEREVENNTGHVKGTLTAKDGAQTAVEYQLIKEDGEWKILGISVLPTGAGIEIKDKAKDSSQDSSAKDKSSSNTFEDRNNRYSINYPTDWTYEEPSKGTVIFSGKKGTSAYYSTINIQTVLAKKSGGNYSTVDELMDSLKKQIPQLSADAKILNEGDVELPKNPEKFKGKSLVFTYNYKGQSFKQMQVVILRNDELAFYTWAYTAPADQYDREIPVAKNMFESWTIE